MPITHWYRSIPLNAVDTIVSSTRRSTAGWIPVRSPHVPRGEHKVRLEGVDPDGHVLVAQTPTFTSPLEIAQAVIDAGGLA